MLFQDGALFGSMNLYDNIAFPLREHTKKSESEIRSIVMEKMDLVGLHGAEGKLPGEISGGMRKRAGLARALVLDPEIILFDEPDSGLDPVRTAYLNQLIVDLNAQIDATFLIVTHDINTARTVPDNIGLLFRRHLAMFGPREMLLSSSRSRSSGSSSTPRRVGPIGMSEEKDADELAAEAESGQELPPAAADPAAAAAQRRRRPAAAERPRRATWCRDERRDRRRPGRSSRRRGVRIRRRPASAVEAPVQPAERTRRPARCGRAARCSRWSSTSVRAAAEAAVPGQGVHPAVLVHRQRHDPADGAGRRSRSARSSRCSSAR